MPDLSRVKALFFEAQDQPEGERAAWLERACGGDEGLRARVAELLGYATDPRSPKAAAEEFVQRGETAPPAAVPETIGGYRIRGVVGQGGMGVVYDAEQETPRRRVALKVLRAGLSGAVALRRFELEAELLGRLEHPGIAQVFEAGSDPDQGIPFIVMEFVEGRSITRFVDEERWPLRRRLELLAAVCDAVQHAHAKGVVHRDLKPGNILVDAGGKPKVLDFGVARVLDEELRSTTLRTSAGEVVGTVSYMSPEQASGVPEEVDARSDIYALGVIGYELVTGELPHDVRGKLLHEAVLAIRDEPPQRPREHVPTLDEDVETILLTALDKDKARRYQTADALGADIRRHLAAEPIAAHPPSGWYQVKMFARRHRALVVGAAAFVVTLVAGLVATTMYALRAEEAAALEREAVTRQRAATEAAREAQERAEAATYSAQIQAIVAALEAGRAQESRRILDETQASRRGWEWHHLDARLDSCDLLLGDDVRLVESVAMAKDGRHLVTMTPGGRMTVRSLETHDVLHEVDLSPRSPVRAFDVDADRVALVLADRRVLLISVDGPTPELVASTTSPSDPSGAVTHVSLRGGRVMLRVGHDVHAWVADEDGPPKPVLTRVDTAAMSPDGRHIAGGAMAVHDTATSMRLRHLEEGAPSLTASTFDAAGERLAFGSEEPSIFIMDFATGRRQRYFRARRTRIEAVAFTPDGTRLVTGDRIGDLHVWNPATGEFLRSLLGHRASIRGLVASADGRHVAAVAADGTVRVWDLRRRTDILVQGNAGTHLQSAVFSPRGDLVVTGDREGRIRIHDGRLAEPVRLGAWVRGAPRGVAWTTDGARLLVSMPRTVVLDAVTGEEVYGAPRRWELDVAWPGRLTFGRAPCPRRRLEVMEARAANAPLRIVDRRTGEVVHERPSGEVLFGSAFSADGALLALAWERGVVQVLETDGFTEIAILDGHSGPVHSVAFSPDGTRLASGGEDRTVRLWNTGDWSQTVLLHGHQGDVQALNFAADGTRLVSASFDGSFRIWSRVPRRILVAESVADRRAREALVATHDDAGLAARWTDARDVHARRLLLERRADAERAGVDVPTVAGEHGSRFGRALVALTAPDGETILAVGAPLAGDMAGAVDFVGTSPPRRLQGIAGPEPSASFGRSLAVIDDLDGDGRDDLAVGAPTAAGKAGPRTGAVFLISATREVLHRIEGAWSGARLGRSLSLGADYDGDGRRELLISGRVQRTPLVVYSPSRRKALLTMETGEVGEPALAPWPDADGDGTADVAVLHGSGKLEVVSVLTGKTVVERRVPFASGFVPQALACPDLDGDGVPELFCGMLGMSPGGQSRDPDRPSADVSLHLSGAGEARWLRKIIRARPRHQGPRLHRLDDLDLDGVPELMVWSSHRQGRHPHDGAALTVVSGATGATLAEIPTAPDANRGYGCAFVLLDHDGDGRLDIVLGSPDTTPPRLEFHPLGLSVPSKR